MHEHLIALDVLRVAARVLVARDDGQRGSAAIRRRLPSDHRLTMWGR